MVWHINNLSFSLAIFPRIRLVPKRKDEFGTVFCKRGIKGVFFTMLIKGGGGFVVAKNKH